MRSEASTQASGTPHPSLLLSSAPHTRPERPAGPAVSLALTGRSAESHLWHDWLPVQTSFGDLQRWFLTRSSSNLRLAALILLL